MPRTHPPKDIQPDTPAHDARWRELALLIAYLVICLLSVLTVLAPTTENEEEHAKPKTLSSPRSTPQAK
jgi:hypothetical protein